MKDAWMTLQRQHPRPDKLLAACEEEVKKRMGEIGIVEKLLYHIKTTQIYREVCDSWGEYCSSRFGRSRKWGDYHVKAYEETQIALPPPEPEPPAVRATADGEPVDATVIEEPVPDDPVEEPTPQLRVELPKDCTQELTPEVAQILHETQAQMGHIIRLGHQFRRHVASIGGTEAGRYVPANVLAKAVKDVLAELRKWSPYAPCPYCRQGQVTKKCKSCGGAGWVDKTRWDISEKELR